LAAHAPQAASSRTEGALSAFLHSRAGRVPGILSFLPGPVEPFQGISGTRLPEPYHIAGGYALVLCSLYRVPSVASGTSELEHEMLTAEWGAAGRSDFTHLRLGEQKGDYVWPTS
jgi:hypothetical protein